MEQGGGSTTLQLLGGHRLQIMGAEVFVPHRSRRVLAYLGLYGPLLRSRLAQELWPETTDAKALGNLRAALAEAHRYGGELLEIRGDQIAIAFGTQIDVRQVRDLRRADVGSIRAALELVESGELLPGWFDDWVLAARRELTAVRLDILDRLFTESYGAGDLTTALRAATAAVNFEPLRESSHRGLAQVYLAMGDPVMAFLVYRDYRRRCIVEFGLAPSRLFEDMVEPLLRERRSRRAEQQLPPKAF